MKIPTLHAVLAALVVGAACKSPPAAESPEVVPRDALVAQPCPGLALDAEPLDPKNARVFVEVAEVSRQDLPNPLGRWLDENIVQVRSTANLVAFPGVPTSMPWSQCVDAVCADVKRTVFVTAQLPERTSDPIELAVRIEERLAEGEPPKTLLDTSVSSPHQEPVVLPKSPAVSDGSLIVTPYLLRKFDDLQRVMECKARQAEREKQAR
jgi:hypothetical protein